MPQYKANGNFNHPDFMGVHTQGHIYEYDSVPQFLIDAGYFTLVALEVTEVGKVVIENKKYKGKITKK